MKHTLIFALTLLPVPAITFAQAQATRNEKNAAETSSGAKTPTTAPTTRAVTAKATKLADREDLSSRLGQRFTSAAAGVSFRPPMGGTMYKQVGIGTDIVQYTSTEEKWTLKVSRLFFQQPAALLGVDDPKTPDINESQIHPGILDEIILQTRDKNAGMNVLRKDVSTAGVGNYESGLIVSRYTTGQQTWLRQQAVISDPFFPGRVYYVFDFTTPSGWSPKDKEGSEDPAERMAVELFDVVTDTVEMIDQKDLIQDTKMRSFQTLTWQLGLEHRIQAAIKPEQFFRIQKDGKDIGWKYQVEEVGDRRGDSGFYVATLSQTMPEPGVRIDTASEQFCQFDVKTSAREGWVTSTIIDRSGQKDFGTEIGQSEKRTKVIAGRDNKIDLEGTNQPNVRVAKTYMLNVTQTRKTPGAQVVQKELPENSYVPQAINSMLPRLLQLKDPRGYAFTVWLPAEKQLILRYIDVQRERDVRFAGKTQSVIPVMDRIGVEGEPTFHYFSPEGSYLGSETPAQKVCVIATDQQTILKLFPNAVIGRPHVLDQPQEKLDAQ